MATSSCRPAFVTFTFDPHLRTLRRDEKVGLALLALLAALLLLLALLALLTLLAPWAVLGCCAFGGLRGHIGQMWVRCGDLG